MEDLLKEKIRKIEKSLIESEKQSLEFSRDPINFLLEQGLDPEELKTKELNVSSKKEEFIQVNRSCKCFPYFCCGVGCGTYNPNAYGDAHGFS